MPQLPEDADWPWWDDYGPLAFIASVDCAVLPVAALDIALPTPGTLLFFYCDGQVDEETVVGTWDPDTQAGARVVYVPPGTPTTEATTLDELEPYPAVPLAVRMVGSEPGWDHPARLEAFLTPEASQARGERERPVDQARLEWRRRAGWGTQPLSFVPSRLCRAQPCLRARGHAPRAVSRGGSEQRRV